VHDSMRGAGSFDRALAGADAAMAAGVRVEFSCVVGRHNAGAVRELIDIVEERRSSVVFQPVLSSLFIGRPRDGSAFELSPAACRQAFAQIEKEKRRTRAVGNGWSSLRHFRRFPADTPIPCAAGWIFATLDPEGVLFVCDQVDRVDRSNSVLRLGARAAFARLDRRGCGQCWCARLVEGNLQWGGRIDKMLPPLLHDKLKCRCRLVIRSRARGEGKRSGEAPK
ncbi:MAG: hypothetical protein IMZ65_00055, partial [Planctomycetes bacterium]|nr:hypothetical protein [Planctomycetota bacterium]